MITLLLNIDLLFVNIQTNGSDWLIDWLIDWLKHN